MTRRKIGICSALVGIVIATTAFAQPGDRRMNVWARVLDRVFPLDVEPKPYFSKMVLRYGDTNSQLVVVVYPGAKAELIRYWVSVPSGDFLSELISKASSAPSEADVETIAAKLKIGVSRSPLDFEALERALKRLKAIRVSPLLANRVCVDACSEYEFWYDTWGESVHYVLTSPGDTEPQDELAKWMIEFRGKANRMVISLPADDP